jgi:hypothetical protein
MDSGLQKEMALALLNNADTFKGSLEPMLDIDSFVPEEKTQTVPEMTNQELQECKQMEMALSLLNYADTLKDSHESMMSSFVPEEKCHETQTQTVPEMTNQQEEECKKTEMALSLLNYADAFKDSHGPVVGSVVAKEKCRKTQTMTELTNQQLEDYKHSPETELAELVCAVCDAKNYRHLGEYLEVYIQDTQCFLMNIKFIFVSETGILVFSRVRSNCSRLSQGHGKLLKSCLMTLHLHFLSFGSMFVSIRYERF